MLKPKTSSSAIAVIADHTACSSTIRYNNYCMISILTPGLLYIHCDCSVSTCE